MRLPMLVVLAFTAVLGVLSMVPAEAKVLGASALSSSVSYAGDQPEGKLDIDINVDRGSDGGQWYENPMWIAIGGLALIVLIALIVMAGRGGGTTVVKG